MPYSAHPLVNTGDLWPASSQNTYVKGNFEVGLPDQFTAKGDLYVGTGSDAGTILTVGADHLILAAKSSETSGLVYGSFNGGVAFLISGGGAAYATGTREGAIPLPYNLTINRVSLFHDQSSTTTIDLWVDTAANWPPTDADSITASAPLATTATTYVDNFTKTGWTTDLASLSLMRVNVDANDNATWSLVFIRWSRRF